MSTPTVTFPVEILSSIVRQATLVPELLDTSPSIYFESRNTIIKDFRESMKTKLSLSLVSKSFHDVMESYLYEVVMIFRFEYVPILLQRLQSIFPRSTIPRGHRCQRLDLYLGVGDLRRKDEAWYESDLRYKDEAWYEGGHTLWGLIPACPNLKSLVARVVSARFLPCLTHNALWKTIATYLAKTIRRLELYGFEIRMDRVEMMLRYLTKLEACSIVNVSAFNPLKDTYDDEEPKMRVIHRGSCKSSSLIEDDWDYSTPSGYFNALTVSEFKAAKENSRWPPFNASAPYTLSHLHTLRLDIFDSKRMNQFNCPHLCHLDIYSYSKTECLSSSRGFFSESISHLAYAGKASSIAQIIGFFPQLRHITLSVEYSELPDSHFTHPHTCLEVIELATWYSFFKPQPQIKDILTGVRADKLPRLRMIQVTRPGKPSYFDDVYLDEEKDCADFGVTLQVVIRERPIFCKMDKHHHG